MNRNWPLPKPNNAPIVKHYEGWILPAYVSQKLPFNYDTRLPYPPPLAVDQSTELEEYLKELSIKNE